MKEIIVLIVIALFLLAGFIALLVRGIVRKKRSFIRTAAVVFLIFIYCVTRAGYLFSYKSYNKLKSALKPRSGEEIYTALFGKAMYSCTKVIRYQDQAVPKIDIAIRLEAKICPAELRRILSLHAYTASKGVAKDIAGSQDWFDQTTLGDSVLIFRYQRDDYGSEQVIYSSSDSTKIFCVDFSE